MFNLWPITERHLYLDLAKKGIEVKTSQHPPLLEQSNQLYLRPVVSE